MRFLGIFTPPLRHLCTTSAPPLDPSIFFVCFNTYILSFQIMVEQKNRNVELPRLKRSTSTWEGKVIEYLLAYPGKTAVELTTEAITSYWLVEALEGKVSDEEFQKACRCASENLLKKLASIQQMSGLSLNTITSVPSFTEPIPENKRQVGLQAPQQQEDEEDELNIDIQLTEEMMDVNEALTGVD
jgi:hypothetical protein